MRKSVKTELLQHILDCINDGIIDNDNFEDRHYYCFNADYYLIGYYDCSQWLKTHNIDCFEAIAICQEWELDNYGKITNNYNNSEITVSTLVYIYGEELFYNDLSDCETIEELKETIEELI